MKNFRLFYSPIIFAGWVAFAACSHKTVPAASSSSHAHSKNYEATANNNSGTKNMQQDILSNINDYRQSIGLPALQMDDAISRQAAKHSANMAAKITPFGHTGFEARVEAISKSMGPVSAAAENVAEGNLSAKQVVAGWLHSPGHKKNIEGKYTLTGIGYAADANGVIYFTQIFIRK
jgi:uncharacterized protein YkwD